MRVWIDTKACVGNGICEELSPEGGGGDGNRRLPEGPDGILTVPQPLEASVIEAAEECPAACIYLEDD